MTEIREDGGAIWYVRERTGFGISEEVSSRIPIEHLQFEMPVKYQPGVVKEVVVYIMHSVNIYCKFNLCQPAVGVIQRCK